VIVLGIGGRPGASPEALLELVDKLLADHGHVLVDVAEVVTLDRRAGHPGVRRLADAAGARLRTWTAEELSTQRVSHPSARVEAHFGTPSVAEAAVRASGATPAGERRGSDWVLCLGVIEGPDLAHHGDVEVEPGMLDFAVNVHADHPPAFLTEALKSAVDGLARYPDAAAAEAAVAAAHGVPASCVRLTHGAAEAFTLVARQPWQAPLVVHPQFTEPEAALLAAGHRPERWLLRADHDFEIAGNAPAADLVVVGNPTNPTSRLHRPEVLESLAGNGILVVDEALMDAVEDPGHPEFSLTRQAAERRDLVVIRSLTKTYSIAGLRVGYLVAHPDTLRRLTRERPPWPVSSLAAVAAQACLSDEGRAYAAAVREALPERLAGLAHGLASAGFTVPPDPRGPFLLAQRHDAVPLREALRSQGIAVRRGDTFPGLDDTWLRFAARDAAAVDVLLDAVTRSSGPRRR
jgi:histidinol-phosphate aminotransferase